MPPSAKKKRQQARQQQAQDNLLHVLDNATDAKGTQEETNALINQGHDLLESGDAAGALQLFERARAKGLKYATQENAERTERITSVAMADAHHHLGNYEQSIAERDRASALDAKGVKTKHLTPQLIEQERDNLENTLCSAATGCITKGEAAFKSSNMQQALTEFEKGLGYARRLRTERLKAHLVPTLRCHLGTARLHLGKYAKAVLDQKRALKAAMDAREMVLVQRARAALYASLLGKLGHRFGLELRETEAPGVDKAVDETVDVSDDTATAPAPSGAASPSHDQSDDQQASDSVDGLSISELRKLISQASLSSDDCLERSDLQARAREAVALINKGQGQRGAHRATSAAPAAAASAVEDSERAAAVLMEAAIEANDDPVVAAAVKQLCHSPEAQAKALVVAGMRQDLAAAEAWCKRLRVLASTKTASPSSADASASADTL